MKEHISNEIVEVDIPKVEPGKLIELGDVEPWTLSQEEFDRSAWLFHGTEQGTNFIVNEDFDYSGVDNVTLGDGLYASSNIETARNYAHIRADNRDNIVKLMPYKARMLKLIADDSPEGLSFPAELAEEWKLFASGKIREKIEEIKLQPKKYLYLEKLMDALNNFSTLTQKEFIDFRLDILNTSVSGATLLTNYWDDFCRERGIDGVIYNEMGESYFRNKQDATYVFYNLNTIGGYGDWQRRKKNI